MAFLMFDYFSDHSPFHCILCPKQMPDMSSLMVHLWRHLQKAGKKSNSQNWLELQFWRCRTCQQDFKGLKNFWHHQEQDHKYEQLGMISHKKSLITNFGHKHYWQKFHQKILHFS